MHLRGLPLYCSTAALKDDLKVDTTEATGISNDDRLTLLLALREVDDVVSFFFLLDVWAA